MVVKQTEVIYEEAKETARKVRKMLKTNYPGSKFSVTSETHTFHSTVAVRWIGGVLPNREGIEKQINAFKSATFDGMTDYSDLHGYEFEGKRYCGADYIRYTAPREVTK